MFGTLVLKECKQILKSMVYYIYVVVFVLFLTSQLGIELVDNIKQPEPGQENYGTVNSHEPLAVMEKTLAGLVMEVYYNSFATYPMGFYRGVTLNQQEETEIKSIVEACTGKNWDQILQEMQRHFANYDRSNIQGAMSSQIEYSVVPKEELSYDDFSGYMEQVCKIVGAGSSYRKEALEAGVSVPMTYEQAKEEFEEYVL